MVQAILRYKRRRLTYAIFMRLLFVFGLIFQQALKFFKVPLQGLVVKDSISTSLSSFTTISITK